MFQKVLWMVARFQTVLCQNFNCIPLEPNFGQTHLTTNDRLVRHRTRLIAHREKHSPIFETSLKM